MPESSSTGSTSFDRRDSRLLTFLLVVVSAAAWLLSWPPVDLWAMSFLWAALIVRAAIGARSGWWVAASCLVVYSLAWAWLVRWAENVSVPGYPAMAIYSAAWMMLFVLVYRRIERRGITMTIPLAITAPITWVAVEYLRGEIILGAWTWYLAGLPLVNWPVLAQVADLGGVWMTSLLVLAVGAAGAEWMRPRPRLRQATVSSIVAGLALVLSIAYGLVRLSAEEGPVLGRFLLVQTNLPLDNKLGWGFEDQLEDVGEFMDLTASGLSEAGGADLVIWPEVMVPGIGFDERISRALDEHGELGEWIQFWPVRVRAFVEALGTPMLTGTDTWAGDVEVRTAGEQQWLASTVRYNSATLLGDGPDQSYHKIFPTPFGERLPWIDAWPWLRDKLLDLGARGMVLNLDPGPGPVLLELERPGADPLRLSTPICFEATIPSVSRSLALPVDGGHAADVLVNLTNDGWMGDVDGARLAHAQAARLRCIELRRPMLRCVNTGQTAWYDSAGREVAAVPMRQAGVLLAEPRADSRRTLYVVIGNMVPIACLVLATLAVLITFQRTRLK